MALIRTPQLEIIWKVKSQQSHGELNPGLLACAASALSLSYSNCYWSPLSHYYFLSQDLFFLCSTVVWGMCNFSSLTFLLLEMEE